MKVNLKSLSFVFLSFILSSWYKNHPLCLIRMSTYAKKHKYKDHFKHNKLCKNVEPIPLMNIMCLYSGNKKKHKLKCIIKH